jgi:NADPH-dependent 2,4-dienoyl-CoA reductase/sulfur reductase-like enzyme
MPGGGGRAGGGVSASRAAHAKRDVTAMASVAGDMAAAAAATQVPRDDLPEVLVAGGGIAGLITALALQRKGMKVKVFEKVKEYKLFGGPIQLQCNAQGALDSIAPDVGV